MEDRIILHHAYVWYCLNCSARVFMESPPCEMTDEDRAAYGVTEPGGDFFDVPSHVICDQCGTKFAAVDESDDDPDGEFEDDDDCQSADEDDEVG